MSAWIGGLTYKCTSHVCLACMESGMVKIWDQWRSITSGQRAAWGLQQCMKDSYIKRIGLFSEWVSKISCIQGFNFARQVCSCKCEQVSFFSHKNSSCIRCQLLDTFIPNNRLVQTHPYTSTNMDHTSSFRVLIKGSYNYQIWDAKFWDFGNVFLCHAWQNVINFGILLNLSLIKITLYLDSSFTLKPFFNPKYLQSEWILVKLGFQCRI